MSHTRFLAALLAAFALHLGVGAGLLRAEDEPKPPAPPVEEEPSGEEPDEAPAPRTIEFTDGLEAGTKIAKEQGRLLFVYVGRHSPT